MQKRTVTWVALGGLVAAGLVAWLSQRAPSDLVAAANGKAPSPATAPASGKAPDGKGDMKKGPGGPGGPAPVEVITLTAQRVIEELQAVGTLRSNQSVLLRTEVTGRVERIGFRDGTAVKQGQLLIGLDAALNEAEVAQAKAELELAKANLKRTADLASKNFVSGSAQDTAESNVQVLAARLQLAQARLAKMRVLAPFDGVVGIRTVSVGDVVRDGTDLVNVEDISRLKVDFRLPERAFTQLKVGLPIEVVTDALPGGTYRGRIDAINPRIDAAGRSLEVRAELPNADGRLRPGMFARVRVVVADRPSAYLVPEEAIVPQGDSFFVFRVVDGVARRVPVKLGVRRDGQVELLDNVKAGDRIVTAGVRVQRDGQQVRVLGPATAPGAAPPAPAGEMKKSDAGDGKAAERK
ncbi:MAG: efflux RND transporter periplasmic adaptor subunit [Burkholderiaceae bacterium]|jgi:membrane fusion protein (multidrug efflux system)|nr:efflux RND transporter periplasmic adaptor subunit [Burkholderiaceae bacterium]